MQKADWKALISSRGRLPVIIPLWLLSRQSENAAELKPAWAFLFVKRNPVTLKCQPYLKTDMVFVSLLTPCMTLSVLLKQHGTEHIVHSRSAAPVSQSSALVVVLLVVKSIHPASVELCGRKWHIWSMQQLAHLTQNSLKLLQAGEDKACLLFQHWWWCIACVGGKKTHIEMKRKERPKWRKPENGMVLFLVLYLSQAMWGVAEEIWRCRGLNTATSPCWVRPWCLQAVLNTKLSAPSYPSLSSARKPDELQRWGAHKKNLGQSSFWHGARPSRWATLMKAT